MENSELSNYERFNPDENYGLNTDQVNIRIAQGLTNKVKNKSSKSYLKIFIDNFCTFFNLLCFACFFVLLSVAKDTAISNFAFVFMFVANSIIGVIQEIRAKKTVERLSLVKAPTATVLRNGELTDIAVSDLVLDDIVELSLGSQIPADCIVISGNVEVNESLLTGESVPVKKSSGDSLLSGSFICGGKCFAKCEKVGKDSYIQKLSEKAKAYQKTNSKLLNSLNRIIKTVSILIIPVAIGSGIVNNYVLSSGGQAAYIPDVVIATCSVIIGMIPCGMFFLTTLSLAVGVIKLGNMNTLVQDMYSLEMLARVNVLCLDKTGTITDGNMQVKEFIPLTETNIDIPVVLKTIEEELGDKNQTAEAILQFTKDAQTLEQTVTYKIPFNSARKYSAVAFKNETYVLGAPDYVVKDLSEDVHEQINKQMSVGNRVILLAHADVAIQDETLPELTPVALVVLQDNIRPEAIKTISWFKENDVKVKVISGDDPMTVSEIAGRAGIEDSQNYISLMGLNDQEVIDAAKVYTVFGRVSPEQKALIIKTLKSEGNTVGMTGDGVNDILAMKESDCSVTVASGSGAARNLAHLVLLDNNFNSLPQVVREGRRVVNNIQRSASLYLMKTIFTFVFALISIATLSKYPFTTGMMLMLEFFIIGIPSVMLSLQPNSQRIKGKFIAYVLYHAIPGALVLVLNTLAVKIMKGIPALGISSDVYQTMSGVALTLGGWAFLVVLCHPYDKFRIALVAVITLLAVGGCALILCTNIFTGFFQLVPLIPIKENLKLIGLLVGILALDFPILILSKKLFKQ